MAIEMVQKRDGRLALFNKTKIADAIFKAAQAVGGDDRAMAEELADLVTHFIEKDFKDKIPGIEDIQDLVERALIETGHTKTAKAYILYRDRRARIRTVLQVRRQVKLNSDTTDKALLVEAGTREETTPWDRKKIALALEKEADIPLDVALEIASAVEKKIFASGINRISTALVRELVDNELFERGFNVKLEKQTIIGMPKYDIEQLIFAKNNENSNIATKIGRAHV